jgi:hypothetical protein
MTDQQLQKAQFQRILADGTLQGQPLPVQFNPKEFTLNKGAQFAEIAIPGLDAPIIQFVRGNTETMSMELFFDTTEQGMADGALSVTSKTDEFYRLVKIDSTTHAPPLLLFSWGSVFPGQRPSSIAPGPSQGNQRRYGFKCVVESVQQRYSLFSSQGLPLRAVLTVTLKEYKTLTDQLRELNLQSGDHYKAHVAQHGETLSRISWISYRDPAEWRRIALANDIVDPLALRPGQVLTIPPLNVPFGEES